MEHKKLDIKRLFRIGNANNLLKFVENINNKHISDKPLSRENKLTICVDLDGTLLQEDSTAGAFRYFLKHKIHMVPLALYWALHGKAYLKHKVGHYIPPYSAEFYKYNSTILRLLIALKKRGFYLVLATAANVQIAEIFALKINLFDKIISSNKHFICKSQQKANALDKNFGKLNYIYIGDSVHDIAVWHHSAGAIIVTEDNVDFKKFTQELTTPHIRSINKWQFLKQGPLFTYNYFSKKVDFNL